MQKYGADEEKKEGRRNGEADGDRCVGAVESERLVQCAEKGRQITAGRIRLPRFLRAPHDVFGGNALRRGPFGESSDHYLNIRLGQFRCARIRKYRGTDRRAKVVACLRVNDDRNGESKYEKCDGRSGKH